MEKSKRESVKMPFFSPPNPPPLAPLLMMGFWILLGAAAGIKLAQSIWPYFGFHGGEMAIAIPVGSVAGALGGALLGLIRNPRWQVLLMAVYAGSAAGGVAGKVPWGEIGEVAGQIAGGLIGGITWAAWLFFEPSNNPKHDDPNKPKP